MRTDLRRRMMAPAAVALLALLAIGPVCAAPGPPAPSRFGAMAGLVTDRAGIPQMGAVVALIAPDGRVLRQVYSNDKGAFVFERVLPGLYSLRVSLSSFLPVLKDNVLIEPGVHSFLSINLASLFTTLDVLRGRQSMPDSDDDWKWVVRSASSNRSILRYLPEVVDSDSHQPSNVPTVPAVLAFSGGAGRSSAAGSEADFNTSFSVGNQLFHNTSLMLAGNVGFERSTPAAAFRGTIRRQFSDGTSPEVSVTVRQIFLPGAFWDRTNIQDTGMQSLTLAASNRFSLADTVRLEYGFLYDSISFLDRLNSFSPYGKLIYELENSSVEVTYREGAPRYQLPGGERLREATSDLAVFPRLSMRNNEPTVQRGRHVDVSYQRELGKRTVAQVGFYRDEIRNFALTAVAEANPGLDLLPDVFTDNYSFNSGDFSTSGLRAAVKQKLSDRVEATFAYSYAGVLLPERQALATQSADELRGILQMQKRHALAAKLSANVPVTSTKVYASYRWVIGATPVSPGDIYDESIGQAEPNLNILIRQPLPSFVVLPGRVEALADFRNLLAQGYVPLITADGKRLLMVQNVRSFRGGFSVNF